MNASLKPSTVMTSCPAINSETVHYAVPRFVVDDYGYKWTKSHCQYNNGQKAILFLRVRFGSSGGRQKKYPA
jgi:hypothetical protein